jgi:phage terminase large subunit-like protein
MPKQKLIERFRPVEATTLPKKSPRPRKTLTDAPVTPSEGSASAFQLTAKQVEALKAFAGRAKHIMLEGGSRSGKTFLAVRVIVIRALAAPKSRHALLRLRFSHIKNSIIRDTLPRVMELCFPGVAWHLDKTDWYVKFQNGSELWFGGLDDKERTEKILGMEFATIFLNECSQISYASRNLVLTRLAQQAETYVDGHNIPLRRFFIYDCNPPSQAHWTYQVFHRLTDPDTKATLDGGQYVVVKLNPDDNRANLPDDYFETLDALPARLRKRFRDGEYADTSEHALWTEEIIDARRVDEAPDFIRIVIAVDPSGADDTDHPNDPIGIVACGLGTDGRGYLIEDCTIKAGPKTWGEVATTAYDRHEADIIVGETNYGGEMVKFVVRAAKPDVPFKKVTASRGKHVRAEPISSLTEQDKIRFFGRFPDLEDELIALTSVGYLGQGSPNRADAFVWAMTELFPGIAKKERTQQKARPTGGRSGGSTAWLGV